MGTCVPRMCASGGSWWCGYPVRTKLPIAVQLLCRRHRPDVCVALGVVIRGETRHYELVAESACQGLMQVALEAQIPVINGVIVAETCARRRPVAAVRFGKARNSRRLHLKWPRFDESSPDEQSPVCPATRRPGGRPAIPLCVEPQRSGRPGEDLQVFFEDREHPRDHYAFGEELIHGVIEHVAEIDGKIRTLAQNWEFDRIAKIDLAILRLAISRDAVPEGYSPGRLDQRGHRPVKTVFQCRCQAVHQWHSRPVEGRTWARRAKSVGVTDALPFS